ncbi:HNH endonuclease [Sphingomonas sp. ID0503]|uniref:HNH endonuclease n=1 Tax=Sphingomonas sp. ID0503 TaxID=3399691 RepID=UPI003AFB3C8E
MARLSTLKGRIGTLPGAVGWMPKDARERDRFRDAQPWRKWYKTARWRALRIATFVRDAFTCQMCGRVAPAGELTADHRRPHRGDEALFWDADNVETLCTSPCHVKHKQRLEQGQW